MILGGLSVSAFGVACPIVELQTSYKTSTPVIEAVSISQQRPGPPCH